MKAVFVREEAVRSHPCTCRNLALSSLSHSPEPARAQEENGSPISSGEKDPRFLQEVLFPFLAIVSSGLAHIVSKLLSPS